MDYENLVGSISIQWNLAERHLDRLIHFYMDEESELIDRLLAAVGNRSKGDILNYLVKNREPNPKLSELLKQLVIAFNIHRENRNTIQHGVPDREGYEKRIYKLNSLGVVKEYEITPDRLETVYNEMHEFCGKAALLLSGIIARNENTTGKKVNLFDVATSLEKFPMPRKIDPLPTQ